MEERTAPTELPGTLEEPQPRVTALCPQAGPCAPHQDGHSPNCRALPRGGRQPLQQGGSQTSGSHPKQGSCPQNDYRGRMAPAASFWRRFIWAPSQQRVLAGGSGSGAGAGVVLRQSHLGDSETQDFPTQGSCCTSSPGGPDSVLVHTSQVGLLRLGDNICRILVLHNKKIYHFKHS